MTAGPADGLDAGALLRSRDYVRLLLLAAVIGAPISAAAYYFLQLVDLLQRWLFADLPGALGFAAPPWWWPLPLLALSGVLTGLAITRLPGNGGHSPVDGFGAGARPSPSTLPGILLAALASLGLGVVLGPEAPLIALGAGLGVCAVRLSRRPVPDRTAAVVAATGSFAAISALLGSPIVGAFLLMESAGLGGPVLGLVLLPGLLAAGIGTLVFIGLGSVTGLGVPGLALPGLPEFPHPDAAQFGWAVAIGLAAALLGTAIRRVAVAVRPRVEVRPLVAMPVLGVLVALLAIGYVAATGHPLGDVLFSGEEGLGPLVDNAGAYSAGAILLLLTCKGLGYALSLSAFRGGPVFPAVFLGAAGGVGLAHLPGMSLVPAIAIGIGAMCTVMLRLPMTSVLLATLLLAEDGLTVMPLVIVGVVVAHVAAYRLSPPDRESPRADVRSRTS